MAQNISGIISGLSFILNSTSSINPQITDEKILEEQNRKWWNSFIYYAFATESKLLSAHVYIEKHGIPIFSHDYFKKNPLSSALSQSTKSQHTF